MGKKGGLIKKEENLNNRNKTPEKKRGATSSGYLLSLE